MIIPVSLIALTSLCLSIMAIMRKKYLAAVGSGFDGNLFFVFATTLLVFIIGATASGGFQLFSPTFFTALSYAVISATSSALCIVGPKYGNLSVVIMFATLGSLVLSTVYGIIIEPFSIKEDFYKIVGFIISLIIVFMNYAGDKDNKKSMDAICENESKKRQNKKIYNIICVLLFFVNGSGAVIFKIKTEYFPYVKDYEFLAQYAFISLVLAAILFFIYRAFQKSKEQLIPLKKFFSLSVMNPILIFGLVYFVADFAGLITTAMLPLVVKSGLSFSLPLIMTAFFDFIVYGQKLVKKNYIQMTLALICCILFSL